MRDFLYKDHYKMKKARLAVLEKYNNTCAYCSKPAKVVHHLDGSYDNHSEDNLIPLCASCHISLHRAALKITWDADVIIYYMKLMGLDKKELAKKAGLKTPAVYAFLRTGNTKNSTVRKIADALGCPIETFIKEDV